MKGECDEHTPEPRASIGRQRHPHDDNTPHDNTPQKDPEDWVTGDEAMTAAQRSYLHTLCTEAGETFDEGLTKAEASKRIDELRHKTGRGITH